MVKIFYRIALVAIGYTLMASPVFAIKILGTEIKCDPALAPNAGGCGIDDFILLIKGIIGFLQIIVIPLAVGFIVYGGFVILMAGARGGEQDLKRGKEIITAAIIGIAISLGAYLLVTALNFLIPAGTGFQFK